MSCIVLRYIFVGKYFWQINFCHTAIDSIISYSGEFSRDNILVDFVVSIKPQFFLPTNKGCVTHEQGMCYPRTRDVHE